MKATRTVTTDDKFIFTRQELVEMVMQKLGITGAVDDARVWVTSTKPQGGTGPFIYVDMESDGEITVCISMKTLEKAT